MRPTSSMFSILSSFAIAYFLDVLFLEAVAGDEVVFDRVLGLRDFFPGDVACLFLGLGLDTTSKRSVRG